ncbi:MAG TPA: NAD-dependent protein deacylase [Eubacterium sp.]|jgi:NAD-dependent deacetylase|nr:NAD-dependent protein deacylase [Eubacterium sp.]
MNTYSEFYDIVDGSDNIVFFGGAGVSTESGIPDFRSEDGLYNQKYDYPPETIISHSFFMHNPKEFYRFYRDKMIYKDAKPSTTHIALANLEKMGKCRGVITQNIDGLHQLAGSQHVVELHGSVLRNYCMNCHEFYDVDAVLDGGDIPRCKCGGMIKPDVVLYEEGLNSSDISEAIRLIQEADVLIIGGTSLGVYPAAGLIDYYRGNKLVLINKSTTPMDYKANLLIHDSLGKVFEHYV